MNELNLSILIAGVIGKATPIVLAALGETITEKGGLINLSLDGSILLSAMAAFVVTFETGNLIMGFITGAGVGSVVAGVVAVFSVYLGQSQVAVGFVLTLEVGGRASRSRLCQRDRPAKGTTFLCGLRWIACGTCRGYIFSFHQTGMGTSPGSRRNRVDCAGYRYFWRMESDKGRDWGIPFLFFAGYCYLLPGMAPFSACTGFPGCAFL